MTETTFWSFYPLPIYYASHSVFPEHLLLNTSRFSCQENWSTYFKSCFYTTKFHFCKLFRKILCLTMRMVRKPDFVCMSQKMVFCFQNCSDLIAHDDRAANLATENINRSIKLVAWPITKTSLSDKVSSKPVLEKAGLWTLNEMVASQTV